MSDTSSVSSVPAPDQTFLSHLTLADLMGDSVLQDLLHSIYSISGLRISLTTCQGDRILALHEYMTPFSSGQIMTLRFTMPGLLMHPGRREAGRRPKGPFSLSLLRGTGLCSNPRVGGKYLCRHLGHQPASGSRNGKWSSSSRCARTSPIWFPRM